MVLTFVSYPQPFFPLFSVTEALSALSFPFLSELFFFVHANAALAHSQNQQQSVTGQFLLPKMTLSMRVGHVNSAYNILDTTDIPTE